MARITCSTWDGGGNVAVFRGVAALLETAGHDVSIQVAWDTPPALDGDLLLLDHMTSIDGLQAGASSGVPMATLVHTLWSFVPSLEGTFAPAGYLDTLAALPRNLVVGLPELDGGPFPANVVHVGPAIEPHDPVGWTPPEGPLVVVSLGTTPLDEAEVLQRLLDGLGDLDLNVVATAGPHIDRAALRVPSNTEVHGFVPHGELLPHAAVFVGHGGHGGIMAALSHGVPIVSIPLDRDQPHNADRLEAIGAGTTVAPDADPTRLAEAVEAARNDESLRVAATRQAESIASYDGAILSEIDALLERA